VAPRLEAAEAGGLLYQRAPLLGLRGEDCLDLALADDRMHALAEPEVGEDLDQVEASHRGLVEQVLPLPAAMERRATESSAYSTGTVPSWLSNSSSTSQKSAGRGSPRRQRGRPSGFSARSSFGLSDPAAQRIASATFDFPEAVRPTMTPTPGSRRTSTGSGND